MTYALPNTTVTPQYVTRAGGEGPWGRTDEDKWDPVGTVVDTAATRVGWFNPSNLHTQMHENVTSNYFNSCYRI